MTRRIKKQLQSFFNKQLLNSKEQNFIDTCIYMQSQHPQLTSAQWKVILEIENKYKNSPKPRLSEESDC